MANIRLIAVSIGSDMSLFFFKIIRNKLLPTKYGRISLAEFGFGVPVNLTRAIVRFSCR